MIDVHQAGTEDEELSSLEIYNRVFPWDSITIDQVRDFSRSAQAYSDYLARRDGVPAGSLAIALAPSRPTTGLAFLTVLPEQRGLGVGGALLDTALAWLAERAIAVVEGIVPEDDAASLAWANRRGFEEVERNARLVLELDDYEPPTVKPPVGIEIRTWAERPELASAIYDVACETFPDIPGAEEEVMEPFEDWLEHHMRGSGDRPEATFIALAGDEVVGYAKFSLTPARPRDATHDMTGVKRAWRGRGIAGALKRKQIEWAKSEGYKRLVTQNEVRNEPIRRLNERLGYRRAPGRIVVRGTV